MSIYQNNETRRSVHFRGFTGIRREKTEEDDRSSAELVNFRVLTDGSLVKRCGYAPLLSLPETIRAIFTGKDEQGFCGYLLSTNQVYFFDVANRVAAPIGTVGTNQGKASFFYFHDSVYLLDGEEIYRVQRDSCLPAQGYVPLFGDGWNTGEEGEICEPLNLLTRRARIRYRARGDGISMYLCTIHRVERVDALYRNGELVDPSEYVLDEHYNTIDLPGLRDGDNVEAFVTFTEGVIPQTDWVKNPYGVVYGGIHNSRIFFYGGAQNNKMYCSLHASEAGIRDARRVYPESCALYVPVDGEYTVGEERYRITAVSRHYDRLLIFTDGGTWMANHEDWGSERFPVMRINTAVGCSIDCCVTLCGNDPISIHRGKIFRFSSRTDELDECNARCISSVLGESDELSLGEQVIMTADPHHGEILIRNTEDPTGRVLVMNMESGEWYTYDGICADLFFDGGENLGFVRGNALYLFDESLSEDYDEDGLSHTIEAVVKTHPLSFSEPEQSKRLLGISLNVAPEGEDVEVSLVGERTSGEIWLPRGTERTVGKQEIRKRRLSSGRFCRLYAVLRATGKKGLRIFSLRLSVKR